MSSKPLSPSETSETAKGEAKGGIKGTITNLITKIEYPFNATWIYRDEQQETLRFHGTMPDPENDHKKVAVALQLSQKNAPTGTYPFDSPKVLHLSYLKYDVDGEGHSVYYEAISGHVDLVNAYPDSPISGKLVFKTTVIDDISYRVDVKYSITEF
ncbi:hypothetical protein [Pseudomonas sp. F01002]|uniref:hypothetical protein n=1 Tax=Pseudomonas sp. F01002 TaxID=2555724 RepID=UPI00106A0EA6|nr:hypothetical protein [Pseudomonas sp. F01002]TFB36898.1 hypothetical protein E3W21_22640 [Pseudomonas sp. F01002]